VAAHQCIALVEIPPPRLPPWQSKVKSGHNKIMYQDILTGLADATNDLYMPCHEQWTGATTVSDPFSFH